MNSTLSVSSQISQFLLEIQAVKLQPNEPFTWASGWKSPIYCDNRVTLSYPAIRSYITKALAELIKKQFPKVEVIAGVATAGIPQGALVAEALGIPFCYVRSSPKGHGMGNMIEGKIDSQQQVVVIEDLISTGSSSLKAVQALKEVGANVLGLAAIFTYGFGVAEENFAAQQCTFYTLSNYDELVQQALKAGYINAEQLDTLKNWKENPSTWNQ